MPKFLDGQVGKRPFKQIIYWPPWATTWTTTSIQLQKLELKGPISNLRAFPVLADEEQALPNRKINKRLRVFPALL